MTDCMAETIPSKVYEYLAAGRPILGLVHRNAELAGILTGLGRTVAESANAGSVRGAISEIHRRWKAGALENPAGSPYAIASAIDRLIATADSLNPA